MSRTALVGILVVLGLAGYVAAGCAPEPQPAPSWLAPSESASDSASDSASTNPSATPIVTPSPTPTPPGKVNYAFPVVGNVSYARTHSGYPASDIIAKCGAEVRAVVDGAVLEVNRVDRWDPDSDEGGARGGKFLSILGADGVRYYGGHFQEIDESLRPGVRVKAGQPVGEVGSTGRSSACHLHFGISPPCERVGDWAVRRGVIWPWSYLDSWHDGGDKSPVAEVGRWLDEHGCP